MLFATPLVPNEVQYIPRPPTYDIPGLAPSDRQSFWLLPISIALQISTLAIIGPLPKTSFLRAFLPAVVVPVIVGIGIQAALFCHHLTSPVINFAYGTAAVCLTLQGIDLLLVIPYRYEIPITEIFKIPSKPCPSVNPTWQQRFNWAGACYNNPRMLLTPFEPSLLKRRRAKVAQLTRSQFLLNRATRVLTIWILIDFLLAWCRWDLWFSSKAHPITLPDTILTGSVRTILGASAIWMAVDSEHMICALVMVGIAGDDHKEWPDLFGIWTEEWYTLADFWAIAWHGLFRQQFIFLTHTVKSPLLRVSIPFMFSAVLHFAGAWMQSRDGLEAAAFLMLQPVGIIVQQMVLGGNGTVGWKRKLFAWITTMVWLIATGYGFIETYAKGGMYDIEPIPISFLSLLGIVEGPVYRWRGILDHFQNH
ncbi:hypothetical protein H072_6569 [Dactylellina haptotyla CBS 200.50]|uniref:Wax synthase domain-containing protein n=1 Tax=Dactylellina haptotyla (strain CBS 200.50) TaxID=1284197 RepID=S8A9F0_DACHA|nr:hypothetical protein H072_6569 [Dactylellina haptotyla CBS 200.50]